MTEGPGLAVATVSGGMDSTTLAYLLAGQNYDLLLVSFDYGQRHAKELRYAERTAEALGAQHQVVPMHWLAPMIAGTSSLVTDSVQVPDGHYAEETMRATVVPNRNAIMLNIAAGIAIANNATRLSLGVHAGDHFVYPDCRPAFIAAQTAAILTGNEGFIGTDFRVDAPFLYMSKADIASLGDGLGVPWEDTWSCYKGGERHCGRCGTCVERREAFRLAGVDDPTEYDDMDFAWQAIASAEEAHA